jgi:hypothetical protein
VTIGAGVTIAAIAVIAFALCDLVHEVLGHGLAVLLVPGVQAISLSSVALQTTGVSRLVAAAGSLANLVVGACALTFFHRRDRFSPGAYFLWLFGTVNLLNGSGYPLYSAALGSGDWEVVVRGFEPAIVWRVGLGVAGAIAYVGAVWLSATELARAVAGDLVSSMEVPGLVLLAYLVGSTLLVAASAFNPIGPSLILLSGVSSGFAAMAGLTAIPKLVENRAGRHARRAPAISFSAGWASAGLVVAIVFTAVIGRGIPI